MASTPPRRAHAILNLYADAQSSEFSDIAVGNAQEVAMMSTFKSYRGVSTRPYIFAEFLQKS